jgi:hypothetical protein
MKQDILVLSVVLSLSSAAAKPKTKTKKEKAVVPSLPSSSSPKSDD